MGAGAGADRIIGAAAGAGRIRGGGGGNSRGEAHGDAHGGTGGAAGIRTIVGGGAGSLPHGNFSFFSVKEARSSVNIIIHLQ